MTQVAATGRLQRHPTTHQATTSAPHLPWHPLPGIPPPRQATPRHPPRRALTTKKVTSGCGGPPLCPAPAATSAARNSACTLPAL